MARWQTEENAGAGGESRSQGAGAAGERDKEPAFGVPRGWISPGLEEQALAAGYTVVDQTTVIRTHMGELIRRHAHELLGRDETKRLMDS